MKLPDEALALLVRQWVAKAEVNYRTALTFMYCR
jgi:hypothetical protein